MKAIVNDKKHITLVSHTNGVTIVEASGCIIDLDFQSLASICEIADLGNTYTIKDCDELDFEWLTIRNSIDSGFFIRFKDTASAARAIGDCRYYISLKDVLDKYENDIVDFNVSAMDIYYIHKASPNVVRKFNYDNFSITCKDQHTANTINTLLNCSNISVYDIVEKFKYEIAYNNVY